MTEAERHAILVRYRRRAAKFDAIAARRTGPARPSPLRLVHSNGDSADLPLADRALGFALTERGRMILGMLASGLNNHEIATQLAIGDETVKTHVARLLAVLQARNRAHAVAIGFERGILPLRH